MPSRGEGFGIVYIEAMRYGLPIIASIHDAAPEINVHGETGYNVDLDRPDELPDAIVRLLRERDHARLLGRQGRKRWQENFSFSAFRSRFRPILHEFLSRAA
jgi:phosphatidylinositol alpha-1,6-mannosyltransferase